ncbi:DDE-type integrase/transposase/recombinase, partial [Oenococcus oeni]|uniref:DDE-type integrase/transposase/recombinase n=1 Tax=Oenococcus oeni TaxID=1247 RepID=UPI000AB0089C
LRPGTWVYLSTIFDQSRRKSIEINIDKEITAKLIIKALLQALSKDSKPTFLHSDMGSQYTSIAYEGLLKRHLIRHSYSKQGYPYDNGPLEAFHSLLKREFIFQTRFTSFEDLVLRVENYINWYNTERIRING